MLGLWVWPGNVANVLPVEHIIISSIEEIAAGEVQYQDHVDCVRHWRAGSSWVRPYRTDVNKEFYKTVLQRLRDALRRHRPEKWRSGEVANGSCTTTTPLPSGLSPQMNFWRNTTFRRSLNLPLPLTLLRVISSCSQHWRKQWKVTDSVTLKIFKSTRRDN